ncbi:4-(cytidine 5'-diphospho)-2-C-methyl-D-erythritol kinase [Ferruginivarius sediminum]|uniref:4-diphosphocytidyl-2-C-methyl-D-erythritol kinase n=1 Tax=Ferruginivarius sediminum TaxID=2661937 RepID=A0A369T9G4_9PROT|nr:4-(cytidine 5'-diphospho)-2-C-methyl-D-erythritol kinase [Ferruginivarius sediminum]RDD61971.1 4-(cytidine 5'-diphospho)-2-C-methyl-D-erythritol kinase [Ferruginivarius sediminum]
MTASGAVSAGKGAITRLARAKVNLSLRVLGRREDGYHELDGLIAFAGVGDRIHVAPAETLSLELSGPFAEALREQDDNLVLRAARRLAAHAGVDAGAMITLDKQLPVAAGLGGGSADAAAALQALSALWSLSPAADELYALALELGADVPICLYGQAAYVSGIGERIGPAPHLPKGWLVLANPGVELSTAAVFRARPERPGHPAHRWDRAPRDVGDLARRLGQDANDLEATARDLAPEIDAVLAALGDTGGCLMARMSGSGATCFGLYADEASADAAAAQLAAAHASWWLRSAPLEG